MWNDTRDCTPLVDGVYLVQMTNGGIMGLEYTREGGWNTHYDSKGNLHTRDAIANIRVARWLNAPTPPEVPDEWFIESMIAREVTR